MESNKTNKNGKATKKIGRPKKESKTALQQTNTNPDKPENKSEPVLVGNILESNNDELNNKLGDSELVMEEPNLYGNPNLVDKAVNTIESLLHGSAKKLEIPLNLEPFTYDEILDYADDLDLSYCKGRSIERDRDEKRYVNGYRHEVIINDKPIGHAIFHNILGNSYWDGYINLEPTYCNPFTVQADITQINFLGCQLKEVTYIDEEHFGFTHLTLEDLDINILTGEPRKRFYATIDVLEKEIIALFIFLNFYLRYRLNKRKSNIIPRDGMKQNKGERSIDEESNIIHGRRGKTESIISSFADSEAKPAAKVTAKAIKALNKRK
jgi:hypothetical protein